MIFYQNYRKEYINPYRTGVKIGNYNEDLFGEELKAKYKNRPLSATTKSEYIDKYKWPKPTIRDIKVSKNEFTNTQNSNFDLNIVFSKENFSDYMKLYHKQETNPYILDDKNKFLPEELEADRRMQMTEGFNMKSNPLVYNTQKILSNNHIKSNNPSKKLKLFNIKKIIVSILYINTNLVTSYSTTRSIKKLNKIKFIIINKRKSKYRGVSKNGNK
jgi:hypothetical protein